MPLKDRLGGIRMLYSHNVQFPRSHLRTGASDVLSMETIMQVFPVLQRIEWRAGERIQLVGETMVEEVLQDIGVLDFGEGISAKVASTARSSASSPTRSSSRTGRRCA